MTSLNQHWENGQFGEWDPLTPTFHETQRDLDMRALRGRPDLRAQRKRGALRLTTMIPAARSKWRAVWPLVASVAVAGLFAAWVWWLT